MTNFKNTKRALISSVLALVLCFAMLLGSTFAWFTDSAKSGSNLIKTGNLAVELYQYTNENPDGVDITESNASVFDANFKWEANATQVVYLAVKNAGNLALKYNLILDVAAEGEKNLTDVMSFKVIEGATLGTVTSWDDTDATKIEAGKNATVLTDVALYPADNAEGKASETVFAIAIHMDKDAGNDYQGKNIAFDIKVLAGQLSAELDSFGNQYDAYASYPGSGFAPNLPANSTQSAIEIPIDNNDSFTVGSVVIPKEALDASAEVIKASIDESTYEGNFTVAAEESTAVFDVKVEGIVENNETPIKVNLTIAPGLKPETVKLYHYDTLIDSTYNPNTGYVTFETKTFSPFTVVYNLNEKYEAPEITDEIVANIPTAKVVYASDYVNTELPWRSYGQWSPTAGLDSNLEAAFVFTCPEDLPAEVEAAFEYWYCDFYVSLNTDLGANQIFLGGNYGSYGWVGFHNGDLTLKANEEIGLLESVTTNPWTYADVRDFVGTFICGVGDVNNALNGATFTVKLRLTNPENKAEFYDVNVVTYTFGGAYEIK